MYHIYIYISICTQKVFYANELGHSIAPHFQSVMPRVLFMFFFSITIHNNDDGLCVSARSNLLLLLLFVVIYMIQCTLPIQANTPSCGSLYNLSVLLFNKIQTKKKRRK